LLIGEEDLVGRGLGSEVLVRFAGEVVFARVYPRTNHTFDATQSPPERETADVRRFLQSPLTDSNRRLPPYHSLSAATGGRRRPDARIAIDSRGILLAAVLMCVWFAAAEAECDSVGEGEDGAED